MISLESGGREPGARLLPSLTPAALHRARARVTFAPQPFGIKVPLVLLKIDS